MNVIEILRQTLESFRAHKMRVFLTMFGIVWGIASVILLVGLGRGFSVDSKKRMQTLGKDLVIVWGGRTSSQVGGLAAGREMSLTIEDARLIRDECYQIKNVSPELRRSVPEVSPFNSANRGVVGSNGIGTNNLEGLNMFADPSAVFNGFRRCILGIDTSCGGTGNLRGLNRWNLDATLAKEIKFTERVGLQFTMQFTNVFNHFQPGDPRSPPTGPACR